MVQMRGRTALAAALIAAAGIGLGGCGGGSDTIVTDDGTVTVDQGGDSVEIETDDGSATITGQTDSLPEGWPSEVVLPEGGTINSGAAVDQAGAQGWNAALSYPDLSVDELTDALTDSLESKGFESQGSITVPQGTSTLFSGSGFAVSALISEEGSGSALIITVATEG
jgi:hypothetical protein